jgi:hypothetical protein
MARQQVLAANEYRIALAYVLSSRDKVVGQYRPSFDKGRCFEIARV